MLQYGNNSAVITVWVGVKYCRLVIFCVLRELVFAIGKDCFFLLGINFWDFLEIGFK